MSSILGMMVFALGGLAGATFLLPARGVKGWAYETWWMFYCVFGLLVSPAVICAITVPDFWNVAMSASAGSILACVGFGAIKPNFAGNYDTSTSPARFLPNRSLISSGVIPWPMAHMSLAMAASLVMSRP